jgi:hypothetical protein
MMWPLELEKNGARENRERGETRPSRASRIPPTAGFHQKTTQTRRFRVECGFLRCGCCLNHKQPGGRPTAKARRERGAELLLMTLARSYVLRVQCHYSALARFRWLNFGDQEDTQSRKRSNEKEDA